MGDFRDDLYRGKGIEYKVLAQLRKRYPAASLVDGYPGYDIWVPEKHLAIEVKYDPMSNQTGNIVVEIEMSGLPSALFTSTADWWVFYDDHVFAWIKPINIFRCIILNKLEYVEFVGDGDKNAKKAFLIPKKLLFTYARVHGELEDDF
jgi:hypothetical protein